MSKNVTLQISSDAEELIEELGISISDAIAKGLKLLEYAKNGRLALISESEKEEYDLDRKPEIEQIFIIRNQKKISDMRRG